MKPTLRERLLSGLVIDPSGCVLWTRATDRDGYGKVSVAGRMELVHRVMWQLFEGPIPSGQTLDHVKDRGCRNHNCASLAHLEPVAGDENNRRGDSFSAVNARKDRCDRGHRFTRANTYQRPSGGRKCRTCHRDDERARRAAMPAIHLDTKDKP